MNMAKMSWMVYGEFLSAILARSVGVHLSAGAIFTCAGRGVWGWRGGEARAQATRAVARQFLHAESLLRVAGAF